MPQEYATFMIGGQEVKLGPLSMWSLEQAWNDILALAVPSEPFPRTKVQLRIIAAGMMDENIDGRVTEMHKKITWDEAQNLSAGMVRLLAISGLGPAEQTPGPPLPGEAGAVTSTETGPGSSPNS